ncbi:MAG TPA: PilX N-terminal domain-containing pilus assembly protein [Luteimonas sp.]|nr:PilX N-terminal domain-containing pilus assembly protein [Luteimonas sp.]
MSRMAPLHPRAQRGVALVVVLVLLVVVTLLALASLRNTILEERMSAAVYDRSLAFQAVEAALREGEAVAATRPEPAPGSACVNGLCGKPDPDVAGDNARWLATGFWDDGSGTWREATVEVGGVTATPRFIVELLDTGLPATGECTTSIDVSPDAACSGTVNHYRITAYSRAEGRAEVMLQSIYAVP